VLDLTPPFRDRYPRLIRACYAAALYYEGRSNRPFQPVSARNAALTGRESLFIIKRPSHERTSPSRDVRDAKRQATRQMNRNTAPNSTEMITRGKVSISAKRLKWSSPQTPGRVWGLVAGTNKGGRCLRKEQTTCLRDICVNNLLAVFVNTGRVKLRRLFATVKCSAPRACTDTRKSLGATMTEARPKRNLRAASRDCQVQFPDRARQRARANLFR
jgi:hypothetical protein